MRNPALAVIRMLTRRLCLVTEIGLVNGNFAGRPKTTYARISSTDRQRVARVLMARS